MSIIATKGLSAKPSPGVDVDWMHPLSSGLIGWWMFNDGGGQVVTDVVGGREATLTNMDPITDWVGGPFGYSVDFDGTNDYLTVANDAAFNLADAITVCIRAKVSVLSSLKRLVEKSWSASWGLTQGATGALIVYMNGDARATTSANAITVGTWHHICFTYDRIRCKIYVDGTEKKDSAYTAAIGVDANPILVCAAVGGGSVMTGQVDDLRIYDRALEASEVLDIAHDPYVNVLPHIWRFVPAAVSGIVPVVHSHRRQMEMI